MTCVALVLGLAAVRIAAADTATPPSAPRAAAESTATHVAADSAGAPHAGAAAAAPVAATTPVAASTARDSLGSRVEADSSVGHGPTVPGTRLHVGDGYARVQRLAGLAPAADAPEAAPDERVLAGPLRFFGVDGASRLTFGSDGLRSAEFEIRPIATHQRDYIEDQLVRSGYRRRWNHLDDKVRDADWTGAMRVHLRADSLHLTAVTTRLGWVATAGSGRRTPEQIEQDRIAAEMRPLLADPTPILDDTLTIDPAAAPGRHAPPAVIHGVPPVYDDALRQRGISGIVRVLALVGLDGRIAYARAIDGPAELKPIGETTARGYRFGSYRDAGKPVRFWVWIPLRFGV